MKMIKLEDKEERKLYINKNFIISVDFLPNKHNVEKNTPIHVLILKTTTDTYWLYGEEAIRIVELLELNNEKV